LKEKLLGIAITVLVLTMLFTSPFLYNIKPAKAGTSTSATIYSNGDTYINSLSNTTNYGTSNDLYVSSISGTGELKYTFLTFNISELVNSTTVITSITNATLSLYCTSEDNGDISCYPSTYWDTSETYPPTFKGENTTTYGSGWSSFTVTNFQNITTTGWKTWDVTTLVNFYGQTDFALAQDHGDHTTVFSSRHTANKPYINITYTYASVTPSNFGKYIKCYFNNSGGDVLTNFVVPISIPTTTLSFWNYVGLYWHDIYFFDEDNATKLYYEVEYPNGWASVDKRMQIWVKVPQINASNTDFIYLYYNYTELIMMPMEQAFNFVLNHTAYWDSNYGDNHPNVWSAANTAWHLGETITFIDSAGANLATATGTLLRNQTGVYDGSVFTNTTLGGYAVDGQAGMFEYNQAFSGSVWVQPWIYTATGAMTPFSKRGPTGTGWEFTINCTGSAGNVYGVFCNTITTNDIVVRGNDTVLNNTVWQFIAFTYDGTHTAAGIQFYVNGVQQSKTTIRDALSASINTTANFQISGRLGNTSNIFQGGLEEIRMYPTNVSSNFIGANYKCGKGTFITYLYPKIWKYLKCYFNNAGGEALTNFTVPINVSSTTWQFWSYVNSSAYDVYFLDSDNTTELYYETEYWNYAANSSLFWVRVPQINASNTDFIYLYYYNPALSSYTSYKDYTKVWTQWNAVYHLYENTGNFNDSSPNAYNMVANHSPIRNVSAVFDNGMKFAESDYLESTSSCGNFTYTDAFSLSAWFRSNKTVSDPHFFVNKLINSGTYRGYEWYLQNGGTGAIYFYLISDFGANNYLGLHSTLNITDNDWHQIAVTYNGNSSQYGVTLYIDGAVATVNYDHNTLSATTYNTIATDIGALGAGATPVSQHMEDETRIIKTNLTSGWIGAEYKCGIGTFVTFVVSKVWFDAETWNGRLYNYSWYGVENWIGQMATKIFNAVELWNGLLTPKLFYNAELWNGLLSTLGFRNVETWSGILHTLGWFTAEHWETNYTDIQEYDIVPLHDDRLLHVTGQEWCTSDADNATNNPWINGYNDFRYLYVYHQLYTEGYFTFNHLPSTIDFTQIKNITVMATWSNNNPPTSNLVLHFYPNSSALYQETWGTLTTGLGNNSYYNVTLQNGNNLLTYLRGIDKLNDLRMSMKLGFDVAPNDVLVDYVVLKVYYYPKYLAIGNWAEFNFVEKFVILFGEYMLITFVRWSILGLGVGFLLLAMILLYAGFKMRKGVLLIAALIVFLLGIVMAIAGAGI